MFAFLMRVKNLLRKHERWQLGIAIGAIAVAWGWNAGCVQLFDWDEINFAEIAREMLLLGDPWRIHVGFEPFWEKPPLYAWMQALSFASFGVSDAVARLPNLFAALATLAIAWHFGTKWHDRVFARRWAWFALASILPHFYFKVGLIDPWFNVWIVLACAWMLDAKWVWAGVALGLAVLTKGPVAYGLMLPVLASKSVRGAGWRAWMKTAGPAMLMGGAWYAALLIRHPDQWSMFWSYLWRLFSSPDAGHRGGWWFHGVAVVLGCVPASMWAFGMTRKKCQSDGVLWVWISMITWVLVLFSVVQTKIVHYSSLVYIPLAYVASAASLQAQSPKAVRRVQWALFGGWVFWATAWSALMWILSNPLDRLTALAGVIPNLGKALENGNLAAALSSGTVSTGMRLWFACAGIATGAGAVLAWRRKLSPWIHGAIAIVVAQTIFGAVLPTVQQWTQGPFVAFAKTLVDRRCILISQDFRSYVQFYYAARRPDVNEQSQCQYFVVKHAHEAAFQNRAGFKRVGKIGQFAFYEKVLK